MFTLLSLPSLSLQDILVPLEASGHYVHRFFTSKITQVRTITIINWRKWHKCPKYYFSSDFFSSVFLTWFVVVSIRIRSSLRNSP